MAAASNGHRKGFRIPEKTALLKFEDSRYAGAEVRVLLNVPLGMVLNIQSLANEQDTSKFLEFMEPFGEEVLLDWNLEDRRGNRIPANGKGMLAVDPAFASFLMAEWSKAVSSVAAPLVKISGDGNTSDQPSIAQGRS